MDIKIYGTPDDNTLEQMRKAASHAPVVGAALMPDSHLGYGLPIGGVLACDNAVMPYAVGVDIACRMRLSILDMDVDVFDRGRDRLAEAIEAETRFGVGANFAQSPRDHPVLDHEDWAIIPIEPEQARAQLGTSGTGNHFVDFGILTVPNGEVGMEGGDYVAVISHSGSRGPGYKTCEKYSALASEQHPEGGDLAWLDLDTDAGREYWRAMNLMGEYAHANHQCIHEALALNLGVRIAGVVENHHNFAWIEDGMVVHRKGSTPAHAGVLGVVPGTMADSSYIVRGLGCAASLNSSAHGAGRAMGRGEAKRTIDRDEWVSLMAERDITVLGAGLDEAPGAYKDIDTVMSEQTELAEIVAQFTPKVVKMAGDRKAKFNFAPPAAGGEVG